MLQRSKEEKQKRKRRLLAISNASDKIAELTNKATLKLEQDKIDEVELY